MGVAGVLAFSVASRTREFGVRLAMGSEPRPLLAGVVKDGLMIAVVGIVTGCIGGVVLTRVAGSYFSEIRLPDAGPLIGAVLVLMLAAVIVSALPAARAARVDVMQALRSE